MKTSHARRHLPPSDSVKVPNPPHSRLKPSERPQSNGHGKSAAANNPPPKGILKCPTGIRGLDELTFGGLPRGRSTLVCGGAGSGKTILAVEFIVHGAHDFKEPGVYLSFDETAKELAENIASIGIDLADLIQRKQVIVDHVVIDRSELTATGDYNLDGLFVRLGQAIKAIGAKRVVLDSVESIFAALPNEVRVRAELCRLFAWLNEAGVTSIITGEQGDNQLTRHGLEEYISDCVVFLDHRASNQVSTRRLRIIKYRGSHHGTSEYPALIDSKGLSVLAISSLSLNYAASNKRVLTGIERLDTMLGGKGFYRGSGILVSGTSGTGKTSLAASFAAQICKLGERCLFLPMEESPDQLIRNMSSIGIDLATPLKSGLLHLHSIQPAIFGLEGHLLHLHNLITQLRPSVVIMDPITNLTSLGDRLQIKAMFTRLIDFLKSQGITTLFTSLTGSEVPLENSVVGISSMIDTWIMLRMIETPTERNRLIYVLKSRGMAHSNQMREFNLTETGIEVLDVYTGSGEDYTGAGRLTRQALDRASALSARQAAEQRERELDLEHRSLKAQISMLQARTAGIESEKAHAREQVRLLAETQHADKGRMSIARQAD
ncbi:MAG: circadian clock protein KaiC [Opitutus sp.]|nr:circadian clock protein KaiC [Opitutus sp.]MCS6248635.1 circadian clock protein KaiC [Opitutus sp.]MCS6274697.1 circadian clock protein KaiC [Opitutus sp.]MCS6276316.1 circadian clock protein KaiC [Opitutus sp.]MCS6302036.1 circadian clock protein KaiC [Opitutus sp.]